MAPPQRERFTFRCDEQRTARPERPHLLSGRLEGRPVEPTFGIIKSVLGFRQFLRGLQSVQHEWALVCIGWNLKRLHRLQIAI